MAETVVSGGRGMNQIAMTIIGPWKEIGQAWDLFCSHVCHRLSYRGSALLFLRKQQGTVVALIVVTIAVYKLGHFVISFFINGDTGFSLEVVNFQKCNLYNKDR